MNDQHTHAGYAGYDTAQTGSFPADPLFGTLPGEQGVAPGSAYDSTFPAGPTAAHHGTYAAQDSSYAAPSWQAGSRPDTHTGTYDGYAAGTQAAYPHPYDTAATGTWPVAGIPGQAGSSDDSGQWDSSAWQQAATHTTTGQWTFTDTGAFPTTTFESALYETGTYQSGTSATGTYENRGEYENRGTYDGTGYDGAPSGYEANAHRTDTHHADTHHYGPTAYATGTYGTGTYDTGAYDTGTYGTGAYGTAGYDTPASGTPAYAATAFATGAYDSGAYDATAWNTAQGPDATPGATGYDQEHMSYAPAEQHPAEQHTSEHPLPEDLVPEQRRASERDGDGPLSQDEPHEHGPVRDAAAGAESEDGDALADAWPDPYVPGPHAHPGAAGHDVRTEGRSAARKSARRRTPAKRSALLTIAVPSACVMGVAGIAAASVGGLGGLGGGEDAKDDTTTMAAADTSTVKALASNTKLDTQLAGVSAAGEDFRDRASRTQERIDLKERQAAEKKKRDADAARKEAARPKYLLPVEQHGLSAYFGQAGVNWMSVHTGIDFPVQYGTPVMAATDGTVRTQWNSAYGNMAIVTMEDGTETWYCHLSSTKIRSGSVKAGDVIAYSGNSGNSTGPHLHFEVRPGGGSAINPLPWLQSHGLNPQ